MSYTTPGGQDRHVQLNSGGHFLGHTNLQFDANLNLLLQNGSKYGVGTNNPFSPIHIVDGLTLRPSFLINTNSQAILATGSTAGLALIGASNSSNTSSSGAIIGLYSGSAPDGFGVRGSAVSGIAVYGVADTGVGGRFQSTTGPGLLVPLGNVGVAQNTPLAPIHVGSGNDAPSSNVNVYASNNADVLFQAKDSGSHDDAVLGVMNTLPVVGTLNALTFIIRVGAFGRMFFNAQGVGVNTSGISLYGATNANVFAFQSSSHPEVDFALGGFRSGSDGLFSNLTTTNDFLGIGTVVASETTKRVAQDNVAWKTFWLNNVSGVLTPVMTLNAISSFISSPGIIESSSGGFKFPDGSIQTQASSTAGNFINNTPGPALQGASFNVIDGVFSRRGGTSFGDIPLVSLTAGSNFRTNSFAPDSYIDYNESNSSGGFGIRSTQGNLGGGYVQWMIGRTSNDFHSVSLHTDTSSNDFIQFGSVGSLVGTTSLFYGMNYNPAAVLQVMDVLPWRDGVADDGTHPLFRVSSESAFIGFTDYLTITRTNSTFGHPIVQSSGDQTGLTMDQPNYIGLYQKNFTITQSGSGGIASFGAYWANQRCAPGVVLAGTHQYLVPGFADVSFPSDYMLLSVSADGLTRIRTVIGSKPQTTGSYSDVSTHSTLGVDGSFATSTLRITSNTTLDDTHQQVIVDATSSDIVITLPIMNDPGAFVLPDATNMNGRQYIIHRLDNSGHVVSIVGSGTYSTIAGDTILRGYETKRFVADCSLGSGGNFAWRELGAVFPNNRSWNIKSGLSLMGGTYFQSNSYGTSSNPAVTYDNSSSLNASNNFITQWYGRGSFDVVSDWFKQRVLQSGAEYFVGGTRIFKIGGTTALSAAQVFTDRDFLFGDNGQIMYSYESSLGGARILLNNDSNPHDLSILGGNVIMGGYLTVAGISNTSILIQQGPIRLAQSDGVSGQTILSQGSNVPPIWGAGGGGTPSAPSNSVQFNSAGSFGGSANFIWGNTSNGLTITGTESIVAATATLPGLSLIQTGNAPGVAITNSGTGNAVRINQNGNSGNPTVANQSGALLIDNSGSTGPAIQIYSHTGGGTDLTGLLFINTDNSAWNEPYIYVKGTSTSGAATNLRIDDPNPDIEMIATNQVAPAGKFEIAIPTAADYLQINGRDVANGAFETIARFSRIAGSTATGGAINGAMEVLNQGAVRHWDYSNGHWVSFRASTQISANVEFIHPAADGASGTALLTLGSGSAHQLYFGSPSAGAGGSDQQIEYNAGGVLAGSTNFRWVDYLSMLTMNGTTFGKNTSLNQMNISGNSRFFNNLTSDGLTSFAGMTVTGMTTFVSGMSSYNALTITANVITKSAFSFTLVATSTLASVTYPVAFPSVGVNPIPVCTPSYQTSFWVSNITNTGFIFNAGTAPTYNQPIYCHALGQPTLA